MYLYDYYYVSVLHYGAGFFPDNIILLTRCYYKWGTQINPMKSFCHYSIKMFPCRQRFDPPPLSDWVDVQKVYSLQSTVYSIQILLSEHQEVGQGYQYVHTYPWSL